MGHVFGKEATPLQVSLSPENILEVASSMHLPYSYLRLAAKEHLNEPVRTAIARYEQLDTLVWWYEELACVGVDGVLRERLADPQAHLTLGYGHILERLLVFRSMGSPLVSCFLFLF